MRLMRKDEFSLVDKIRENAYQQGREDAIAEAETKIKEYGSIWILYTEGISRQDVAEEAITATKAAVINILEKMKEKHNDE